MSTGVFSDRLTSVTFGDYLPSVTQPWVAVYRRAEEMARSPSAIITDMVMLPHVGWQLNSYHLNPGDGAWLSAAQTGILSPGAGMATMAAGHEEFPRFAQQSITGVTYAGDVQASGSPMIRKAPAAGADWSTLLLSADQGAYPGPNPSEDSVNMDRVYVTATGQVEPWDNLTFEFWVPGNNLTARASIANLYFNGPAGVDDAGAANPSKVGLGQYCLKVRGDGKAKLYELLTDGTWVFRYSFMWRTDPTPTHGTVISIAIVNSIWMDASGSFQGDAITFVQSSWGNSPGRYTLISAVATLAETAIRQEHGMVPVYLVPRKAGAPVVVAPVRIDIARDAKVNFAVARHVFKTSGTLLDDYVALNQAIDTTQDLSLFWAGSLPTGCTWDATMVDDTGAALTPTSVTGTYSGDQGQGAVRTFRPSAGMRGYRVQITATSDGRRTPTLRSVAVGRPPVSTSDSPVTPVTVPARETPPALAKTVVCSVQISPQESDPGSENATLVVEDLTGDLTFLRDRHMNPVTVSTTCDDPDVPSSTLFRGYVVSAEGEVRRGDGNRLYPSQSWTRYTLSCVGEWARTSEALLPNRWLPVDPLTNGAIKATDAIRDFLANAYPYSMIDVPDVDIRLFGDGQDNFVSEPGTRVVDLCASFAQDFLGAYFLFDQSAGTKGMTRMLLQKHAPYNNLAVFEVEHPTTLAGDGLPRLPSWSEAYGTTVVSGQTVEHTFIQAGTVRHHRESAEGNCVTVFGAGLGADQSAAGTSDAAQLSQTAIKVDSFNFLGLAPTDAGYPDGSSPEYFGRIVPIQAVDWKLGSQAGVDWKCRRIFERACFSRFFLSFTAPLILVWDSTDPLQSEPRRLRFYDAVQVRQNDGTLSQFLVVDCAPSYTKDGIQMASYLLVTQSNIDTIGVIPTRSSVLRELKKALARLHGSGYDQHAAPNFTKQKGGNHASGAIMGLPQPTSDPIQDLDPISPTFGQFYGMAGYDPLSGFLLH